jgi:nitronate monooxygenase
MSAPQIAQWAAAFRSASDGPFQLNLWIPDPPPHRDPNHEQQVREFLGEWGPPVAASAGDQRPPYFQQQCEAMLQASPRAISSIMGLYPPDFVKRLKAQHLLWFATATTVAEALAAEAAGADVIIAQGSEAGGHRGAFNAADACSQAVGTMALVPAIADCVDLPVIATGGIADARGVAAALLLGASAVAIGTGYLRCPEARIPSAWADALGDSLPEQTRLTRAFSGRTGRSIRTAYVDAAASRTAPIPAPYPVQRGLTSAMRKVAAAENDIARIQAWAGQSARLAASEPAFELTRRLWSDTRHLLGWEQGGQ